MDLLKLLGMVGGVIGSIASLVFFFLVPEICEPGTGLSAWKFSCLQLGLYSQPEWALALGGATGGLAALASAILKPQHS